MPRNASNAALRVHCLEYWERQGAKVQHCSWVTDIRVSPRNVSQRMRGGRARWTMENEPFNTLKNEGYPCEHTSGHGTQHLSGVVAVVMLLACVVDPTRQRCCARFRAVWAKMGRKRLLWERMRALFYDASLASMRALVAALWDGYETHRPLLRRDATYICPASLPSLSMPPAPPTRHRRRLPRSRHVPVFHLTSDPCGSPFEWYGDTMDAQTAHSFCH
jgi:hypothetical protein